MCYARVCDALLGDLPGDSWRASDVGQTYRVAKVSADATAKGMEAVRHVSEGQSELRKHQGNTQGNVGSDGYCAVSSSRCVVGYKGDRFDR